MSYPDAAAERRMLFATTGVEERTLKTILSAEELMVAQRLVRQLPVGDQVVDAILKLVRSARPGTGIDEELDDLIAWGPGPRASQALMLAVRAKAMIEGRLALRRRRDRSRRARAQAPDGAHFRRPCRRDRHEPDGRAACRAAGVI